MNIHIPGIIRSIRNQNFPLQHALLELIDNSVDAGATRVTIAEIDGDLTIEDDGRGFSNLSSAFDYGKSSKEGSIGRYGVGMKDACIKYSNTTSIESKGRRAEAYWIGIAEESSSDGIVVEEIADNGKTRVTLHEFRTRYRNEIKVDDIQRVYSPLLKSGSMAILINGQSLTALELPRFTKSLRVEFSFRDKGVILEGGIFNSDDPMRGFWAGYNPFYKGRMIGRGGIKNHGVGDEGCTNFSFNLHLSDAKEAWQLATNKDAVEELDELLEHCYDTYTRPLLIEGASAAQDIALKEMEDTISGELNGSGNITRGPRGPSNGKPKSTATGPKKKKTNTPDAPGHYELNGSRKNSKIRFTFQHLGGEKLGEIQNQKQLIIVANRDNPFVEQHKSDGAVIGCIAKMCYAMHESLKGTDTAPDEVINGIMAKAGAELA